MYNNYLVSVKWLLHVVLISDMILFMFAHCGHFILSSCPLRHNNGVLRLEICMHCLQCLQTIMGMLLVACPLYLVPLYVLLHASEAMVMRTNTEM